MQIHFEPTRDPEVIRAILAHPKLYDRLGNDTKPPRDEFRVDLDPSTEYIVARVSGDVAGLFLVIDKGSRCEVHFAFLPSAWGHRTLGTARAFLIWLWTNRRYTQIVGSIRAWNRLALAFVHKLGFEVFGSRENPLPRRGRYELEYLVRLSRPIES